MVHIMVHTGIRGDMIHGTMADTTIHGIMIHGIMEDFMTHGITEDTGADIMVTIGDGMTHGTIITITADGITRHITTTAVRFI